MARKREEKNLRAELAQYSDILEKLRRASEPDALKILHALRTSSSISAMPSQVLSIARPANLKVERTLVPAYSSFEFELTALHSLVYPTIPPLDFSSSTMLSATALCLPDPDEFESHPASPYDQAARLLADTIDPKVISKRESTELQLDNAIVPSLTETSEYCDERLKDLDIQFWTKVPISNDFAARAISFYLETEHCINGFLDAELFVGDLVMHKLEFCSAFLVNSLLCLACVSQKACHCRL